MEGPSPWATPWEPPAPFFWELFWMKWNGRTNATVVSPFASDSGWAWPPSLTGRFKKGRIHPFYFGLKYLRHLNLDLVFDPGDLQRPSQLLFHGANGACGDAAGNDMSVMVETWIHIEGKSVKGDAPVDVKAQGGNLSLSHPNPRVFRITAA